MPLQQEVMAIAKKRGFLYPSYEIYSGIAGFYDYAPLGTAMKNNIENLFREFYLIKEGFAEISCPIITPEIVFKASGHIEKFEDIIVECKNCGEVYSGDHLLKDAFATKFVEVEQEAKRCSKCNGSVETIIEKGGVVFGKGQRWTRCVKCGTIFGNKIEFDWKTPNWIDIFISVFKIKCQNCNSVDNFNPSKPFNLMFKTEIGKGRTGYLRPETAQGIFINFSLLYRYFREKIPFGVIQIGRGYRNEISPRQGVIRLREFNMAEAEVFVNPEDKNKNLAEFKDEILWLISNDGKEEKISLNNAIKQKTIANEFLAYYIALTQKFLIDCGINKEKLRFRQHEKTEMAHYAEDCWDAEVLLSFGWIELVGIADRTCYDLQQHSLFSGKDLTASIKFDVPIEKETEKIIPKMEKLGKEFKKDAIKIKNILDNLDFGELKKGKKIETKEIGKSKDENNESEEKNVIENLNIKDEKIATAILKDNSIELEIADNKFIIAKEFYEVKKVKEKIFGKKITPHVIEPSYGIDRIFYAILEHAYAKEKRENEEITLLKLKNKIAPIKVGVFPLMAKDNLDKKALQIYEMLRKEKIPCYYDESGSIGRRYARMDEIGTPYCITVDYISLEDDCATIRDRDTTKQIRVKVGEVVGWIRGRLDLY